MYIYKITNNINGKIYVGMTKQDIVSRFKQHVKKSKEKVNRHLYDSMNHYGVENFSVQLIEECVDESELKRRERFWIKELDCISPKGYNMTEGGDGGDTLKNWSMEDKRNLWKSQAEKRVGTKRNEQTKKKMSMSAKEREANKTEEEKSSISEKISSTLKEKYASGQIKAIVPKFYGKDHSQFIEVDVQTVLEMIDSCRTLKEISEQLNVSKHAISSRLKEKTGKTFIEWRRHYGITGTLSKPRKNS